MIQTIDSAHQDIKQQATNEPSSCFTSLPTKSIYTNDLLADDVNEQQQPITTTPTEKTPASSINNTHQQLRGRSQTITQKNINSKVDLNDQDKLHHAIQKFDTMHEEALDSDSDSERESDIHIHSNRSTVTSISSLLSNDTNYDMLLARLGSPLSSIATPTSNAAATTAGGIYAMTAPPTQPCTTTTPESSSSSSAPASTASSTPSSSSSYAATDQQEHDIDWEFWSQMISNVDQVIKTNKHYFHHIRQGIPAPLRGSLWPLLSMTKTSKSNSNNVNGAAVIGTVLDDQSYLHLLNKDNIYEKAITQDLDVLFADQHGVFMTKAGRFKESLFHLLKAYANYDDHVGYSKGFAFIALPLLLHMPEEEAFCVFVELMNGTYQWKSLYAPPKDGLSRVLVVFDRLILEHLPKLYHHFGALGIHANDYAKTWFTTLFVSSLPSMDCVYSIYDILLAEGTDALYGFALALLKANQDALLELTEPDELLTYLRDSHMGDIYKDGVNKMVQDSMDFKVQKKRLIKLAKEHQQALSSSMSRNRSVSVSTSISPAATIINDLEALHVARQQNKALTDSVKQRQVQLEQLSKQQGQSAKELVDAKMELARAQQCNDSLRQQSFDLKKALDALPGEVEDRLKEHIHALAKKNMGLVDRNSELEYRLSGMEAMLMDIKARFAQSENERDELNQRLDELRELVN